MKLIMASFFQEENHGTGRKIGISPKKPDDASCDNRFDPLNPGDLYWDYHKSKRDDPKGAGDKFVKAYVEQCEKFVAEVRTAAKEQGTKVFDILPFEDGDTLLSWENQGHMTYRSIAADALRELGYEVEEN